MSSSVERATEYRRTADRLRRLAERAQYPEVQAELTWLAHSYERLAADPCVERIQDGLRSLEIAEDRAPADRKDDAPRGRAGTD